MIQLKRGNDSQAPTFCSARYHTTRREIQALKHRGLLGYVLTERGFLDIHIGVSTRINEVNAPAKLISIPAMIRTCNPSSGLDHGVGVLLLELHRCQINESRVQRQ